MKRRQLGLGALALLLPACTAVDVPDAGRGPLAPVQSTAGQRDYSPGALYAERHGGFLTRAKRYEPKVFARYTLMADAQLQSEAGSFDMQEVRARGDIPIILDPDSYLSVGGEFRQRKYDLSHNVVGARDEDVYVLGARIGAGMFVNDDLLLEAMFRPGVYSDLDGTLTSADWHWFGHVLGTYRLRDDLYLKGGVAVSEDFADVDVIPLAGLALTIHDQWRIDILLPHRAEISWSPNAEATIVRAGIYLEGDQYRVRTAGNRFDWQTQEITVAAGLVQRMNDYVSVFGEIGSAIAGDYKLRDGSSQRFDGSLEPTFYFNVGVGFDF